MKLNCALFHAVVAQDVRINVCILLWHWLLSHYGIELSLDSERVNDALATHRAVYVVPLVLSRALTVHGMSTSQEVGSVS